MKRKKLKLTPKQYLLFGSIIFLLCLFVGFYCTLPVLNFGNPEFYSYFVLIIIYVLMLSTKQFRQKY